MIEIYPEGVFQSLRDCQGQCNIFDGIILVMIEVPLSKLYIVWIWVLCKYINTIEKSTKPWPSIKKKKKVN